MGMFAALDQRILTRYTIKAMDLGESAAYLRHHLALAGREKPLFADDAVARLHRISNGALLTFLWVPSYDRPGRGGQRPPRVRSAMAISASGLW
jgi:type II secretory pathway predicted ATPase ExeA